MNFKKIEWIDKNVAEKYQPKPCVCKICQLPVGAYCPGNQWTKNDQNSTSNQTEGNFEIFFIKISRNRRNKFHFKDFENGKNAQFIMNAEAARNNSWPWIASIHTKSSKITNFDEYVTLSLGFNFSETAKNP